MRRSFTVSGRGASANNPGKGAEREPCIGNAAECISHAAQQCPPFNTKVVGIQERLNEPPGSKTNESHTDQANPDGSERLRQQRIECASGTRCLAAVAQSRKNGQATNEQIDCAPRRV